MSWTDYEIRVWGDMVTITCQGELLYAADKRGVAIETNTLNFNTDQAVRSFAANVAIWMRSLDDALARIREENA